MAPSKLLQANLHKSPVADAVSLKQAASEQQDAGITADRDAPQTAPRAQPVVGYVLLRRRVAAALERTGLGAALIILDGILSIASVANYIASTYDANPMHKAQQADFDLALACYFVCNWAWWLWLDEYKWRYVWSLGTLIDVATTVPVFLSYGGLSIPSLFFLRCLRILRLLRIFRVASISERMANEVFFAAVMLGFTLLCMLLIAGAVFFELETTYGDAYPDLQFHQAVYWAAVTITTVGYGDYLPSIWATQLLLLLFLAATFTLLPYLSGKLVDAVSSTSKYERAKYRPAVLADVSHVVVTGSLDSHNMNNITSEMYHADKGFDNRRTVFVGPQAPSTAMKRVLLATPHFDRLEYLQGSPLDFKDLQRAAVEYADAVFICCNKFAADPATEDRVSLMTVLTVGQYLQQRAVDLHAQRAQCRWRQIMGFFFPFLLKVPETLPRLFVQLLLPESRQRMQHVLQCLMQPDAAAAVQVTSPNESDMKLGTKVAVPDSAKEDEFLKSLALATADVFWQRLARDLSIICMSELRSSLLAHSALGVPGIIPLLTNLTTTLDYTEALRGKCAHAPLWLRDYMAGASQEIYQLAVFPDCLIGVPFPEAAAFIYDLTGALLIATDHGSTALDRRDIRIAPLNSVIERSCSGYIIAPDVGGVVDAIDATHADLDDWRALRSSTSRTLSTLFPDADGDEYGICGPGLLPGAAAVPADAVGGGDTAARSFNKAHGGIMRSGRGSQRGADSSREGVPDGGIMDGDGAVGDDPSAVQASPDIEAPAEPASASPAPSGTPQPPRRGILRHACSEQDIRHAKSTGDFTTSSLTASTTATARQSLAANSRRARSLGTSSAGGRSTGAQSSFGRGPAGGQGPSGSVRAYHGGPRNPILPVPLKGYKYDTKAGSNWTPGAPVGPRRDGVINFLPIHMLRTGNRDKRAAADAVVQEHYHLAPRQAPMAPDVASVSSMLVQSVPFSDHILVVGLPHSQECLFSLLAPLRSRRLKRWRPIVILDQALPLAGTAWDDISRLRDVYYVQGHVGNTDDLLRANAEGAAKAIILPVLVREHEGGLPHMQVALSDEAVVDAYQQLRSINPGIEIYTELLAPGDMAFLRPAQPVPGVGDLQDSLAPAYVSGQVFQPSMIDTLMAQAFYTRGSLGILLRLVNQWHVASAVNSMIQVAKQQRSPVPPDAFLTDSKTPSEAPQAAAAPTAARAPTVLQVPVPDIAVGKPFCGYWHAMLEKRGMLVLGLYRPVNHQGRSFCAVLTNPPKDTLLARGDRAFVIFDLATSEQLPADVLGFDHDLPPPGEAGPGGPAATGFAAAGDGLGINEQDARVANGAEGAQTGPAVQQPWHEQELQEVQKHQQEQQQLVEEQERHQRQLERSFVPLDRRSAPLPQRLVSLPQQPQRRFTLTLPGMGAMRLTSFVQPSEAH